jgi:hypothetical protein
VGAAPTAIAYKSLVRAPRVVHHARGCTVAHREFLTDILSDVSNEFAYDVFRINPADTETFPWLSAMAANYESYQFKRLSFEYIPGCGTSQGGHVIMGVDYDVSDPTDVVTKQMLMAWESTTSSQVWQKQVMRCDPKDLHKLGPTRFTAPLQSNSGASASIQDAGNLFVATTQTNGLTANGTFFNQVEFGQLWVDYEVELTTPQLNAATLATSTAGEHYAPTLPQLLVDNPSSAATPVGSATNLFNFISPASTFITPAGVLNPTSNTVNSSLYTFGLRFVRTLANQLITSAGGAIGANENVLRVGKDFEGIITAILNSTSPFTSAPANLFFETLLPVNNTGATAVNQISTPAARPDAAQNAYLNLSTIVGTQSLQSTFKVKAAAGSFLRLACGSGNFLSGVGPILRFICSSQTLAKDALSDMKPMWTKEPEYVITPGRKAKPHQIKTYLEWLDRKKRADAERVNEPQPQDTTYGCYDSGEVDTAAKSSVPTVKQTGERAPARFY